MIGSQLIGHFLNKSDKSVGNQATAPYASWESQRFLPPALYNSNTNPILNAGIRGIGQLIENPGGLSPTVGDAIRPQLANESQSIAENYRGIGANLAGSAARNNLPFSIKSALQSALDVAQERAQRSARNTALTQSETLRRSDLNQTYSLLDIINQYLSSGRGQAIQGLQAQAGTTANQNATNMALIGSLLSSFQGASGAA